MSHRIGLFLFRNDLRIHDNLALATATAEVDQLICIYCIDPAPPGSSLRGPSPLSPHRKHFLQQSLSDLHNSLKQFGQQLIVTNDSPLNAIPQLITLHNVTRFTVAKMQDIMKIKLGKLLLSVTHLLPLSASLRIPCLNNVTCPFKSSTCLKVSLSSVN